MADEPQTQEPATPEQEPQAKGDPKPNAPEPKGEPTKQEPKKEEPLGDAGKAALDAERSARKAAEKEAREAKAALKKREEADMSEQDRAVAQARREGADEVTSAYRTRLLNAEIRARAAGRFANPEVALKLVDVGDKGFDDEGEINASAIDAEITRLLKDEPYLAAKATTTPPPDFDGGKGSGGGANDNDMNALIRAGAHRG